MRKICLVLSVVVGTNVFAEVNLVGDPEVDGRPLSAEYRLLTHEGQGLGELTDYEEDGTWNHCLRLKILDFGISGAPPRDRPAGTKGLCLDTAVEIGGTATEPGFPVEGGGKYAFSFEARGTAQQAVVSCRVWTKEHGLQRIQSDVGIFRIQKVWTKVKGVVELPADAVRASLVVQLWYDEQYGPNIFKKGDEIYLDRFSFASLDPTKVWPVRAAILPKTGKVVLDGFRSTRADAPARAEVRVNLKADEKALYLGCEMETLRFDKQYAGNGGAAVYQTDDHIDIYIAPEKGEKVHHFIVSSGGGRWMEGDAYDAWIGKAKPTAKGWRVKAVIPWSLCGFAKSPSAGEIVRFNVMRERILGSCEDPKTERGTWSGNHLWYDDATWSFCRGEPSEKKWMGVLFMETAKPFAEKRLAALTEPESKAAAEKLDANDPTALWRGLESLVVKDRMAHLSKQPFVVAQVPPHVNPEIPFMPEELYQPSAVFSAKAAIGERNFIPLALANMTDAFEEYRVTLTSEWCCPEPQHECGKRRPGLKSAADDILGLKNFRILRGVKFRDSDAPNHGSRYDPLVPLNDFGCVPVPPKEAGFVWLEFDTTGLKPGVYRGELLVTALSGNHCRKVNRRNGPVVEIDDDSKAYPVSFTVRPFTLPEGVMGSMLDSRAYDRYAVEFLNRYHETEMIHTPWNYEADFDAEGHLTKRRLRPWAIPHLKLVAAHAKKVGHHPRLAIEYSAYSHFREYIWPKKLIPLGSEAYWRAWREWMLYMNDVITSNGFAQDDVAYELIDEPREDKGIPADEIRRAGEELKKAIPGAIVFFSAGWNWLYSQMADLVTEWNIGEATVAKAWPEARKWAAKGNVVGVYSCNTSLRLNPYNYYRLNAWRSACAGGSFAAMYQFLYQIPSASIRQAPYGEVAYDTGAGIVTTTRLENYYLGIQDIYHFRKLESLATGDSPTAKEARKLLQTAIREIAYVYPHETNRAGDFRERADDLIERLITNK